MKVTYNGQEVELITESYWPEGVTLICSDDGVDWNVHGGIVCLHNCVAFYNRGDCGLTWKYWAILPAKPATRRLTNREVAKLCRAGWDACVCGTVTSAHEYGIHDENDYVEDTSLRAPDSDEWLEPTSDLLEVEA